MLLRTLYARGAMLGRDLAQLLCLPFKVIREPLKFLKDEKCIEVVGGDLVGEVSYKFSLTDLGRKRAQDAMEQCAYVGPAPVPLEDYVEQCYRQTVTGLHCYPETLPAPFAHLVIKDDMFNAVGPAIMSGRSVFIYGPPGNGKTAMARAIGDFMNTAGGSIYVPLRVPGRREHHHRLTTRRCTSSTTTPTEYVRRDRRDRPQAAQHRGRGPALGSHPPAGDRDRRRTEPRHARPAVQRRSRTSTRPRSTSRPTAACS